MTPTPIDDDQVAADFERFRAADALGLPYTLAGRLSRWWWWLCSGHGSLAAARRKIGEDARRFGGQVTWGDDTA